jgi:hypothetical protein
MFKIKLLSICILIFKSGSTQVATPVPSPYNGAKPVTIYIRDVTGRPSSGLADADVEGSPFLNNDFEMGRVVFTNGKMSRDVYLKFDMLNNKLLFLRDGMTLEFVDPIRDFYLQHNENDKSGVVFRGDFPPIDKNTTSTFYELLVDGKITLLNYRYKIMSEYKEYSMTKKKQYVEQSQLYAALPGNKIIRIKKDRKFLMKVMPEYAERIKSITENLKLKDDESVITLFEELNN